MFISEIRTHQSVFQFVDVYVCVQIELRLPLQLLLAMAQTRMAVYLHLFSYVSNQTQILNPSPTRNLIFNFKCKNTVL